MKFNVILTPAEEGGFIVTVPALEGCITEGETEKEEEIVEEAPADSNESSPQSTKETEEAEAEKTKEVKAEEKK